MSVQDGNFCSSDQDELDDLHSPTDVSEDSIEVKVRPIPIRNKRKCTEPRHNPHTPYKKLMLEPVACGVSNEQFHPWYPQQQEEPLSLVLRTDPVRSCTSFTDAKHHVLLSNQLSDITSKEDSDMICTSVSGSVISSPLGSQPCVHTIVRSDCEKSHSSTTLSTNTREIKYLEVKDPVPHDNLIADSGASTKMFVSLKNKFLDSGFIRHPSSKDVKFRPHALLHKDTDTSSFSTDFSKAINGMAQNQEVDSRIKLHTSLLRKPGQGTTFLNATSNKGSDTLTNTVYPLCLYPNEKESKHLSGAHDQVSLSATSVRPQAFFSVPSGSEDSRKPYNAQVEMRCLSVSECGEDLRKNSGCAFSVESLLANGEQGLETNGIKAAQRNYKNMTRERRIEANARERTRVHTISAAFDTLRRAIPSYSHNQKLSKLSVLRIACSYILTLSRIAGYDYSADQSQPTLSECMDCVSRTIQTEGKLRRKKDEQ